MTLGIIRGNDGQAEFNMAEAAKILGYSNPSCVRSALQSAGVLTRASGKSGKAMRVSAYALAEVMAKNRVSPIRGLRGA